MQWKDPAYLWLLLPLLVALVWTYLKQKEKNSSFKFSTVTILKTEMKSLKVLFSRLPLFLKVASLVFVVIALCRPQTADTKIKTNVEGIDIVIAFDISDSMLIEDMKPLNRLEAAKERIQEFVKNRTTDKIGIVIFAGESIYTGSADLRLRINFIPHR